MFNSGLLEVAIDLAAIYLLLSIVCSTANEWIAAAVAKRASTLEAGVATMLANPMFTANVMSNPLIRNLAGNTKKPSYVPSQSFSLSVIGALLQPPLPPAAAAGAPPAPATAAAPGTMANIVAAIAALPNGDLKRSLSALLDDARNDYDKFRASLERWFNDEMDRVSGWYKRWSQGVLLALAALIVLFANVDTIRIARVLWGDSTLRAAIASTVSTSVEKSGATAGGVAAAVQSVPLPVGWCGDPQFPFKSMCGGTPANVTPAPQSGWLAKLAGLLLSIIAVSMGAPVWFDIVGQIVNLRMAGSPPSGSS